MDRELLRVGPSPRIAVEHGGRGPLVLFLHGIGGNRGNWRVQLDAFASDFHVAAWDARGYGESDDYEGPLDFADFSRDLLRVLDALGERQAHLVGLSMGGMIAQDFYRRHPERVRTLVLADTRNGFRRHNAEEFLRQREAPLLAGKTPADIAPAVAASLAGPNASPEARRQLEQSIAALHKESYLKALRTTTLLAEAPEYRSLEGFVDPARIAVPLLVICGSDDTVTPPAMSEDIVRRAPGARYVSIPGAGHLSNIEAPAAFNDALRAFLAENVL